MLYSADILGSAIPIGTTKKTKKAKTVEETEDVAPVVKPKKVLSEEQKEKMKEGRERKKKEASEAALAAIEATRAHEESKLGEEKIKADKKAAAAAKRKATLLAKKAEVVPHVEAVPVEEAPVVKTKQKRKKSVDPEVAIEAALDEAFAESAPGVSVEPPVKKVRKKKDVDPNEPPAWFTNVFKTVLTEKSTVSGDNKPKKQIIEESKSSAQEQWKSGIVRDRVNNETNGHMARLTDMIFGGRQM